MAAIDYFADICADGTEVESPRGAATPQIAFGATIVPLTEDGMFVRAISAFSTQYAIVKGHDDDHAWLADAAGTTVDLGVTHGNYPVCLQATATQIRAVWVASTTQYGTQLFSSALVSAGAATFTDLPAGIAGTSQGMLDLLSTGVPIWTDARIFLTVHGTNLIRPVFRAGWWIGQSDGNQLPDGIYGVHHVTGKRLLLHGQLAFEPHAVLNDAQTAVLWAIRQLDGTAAYGSITEDIRPTMLDTLEAGLVGGLSLEGLYKHPVTDDRTGLMTRPWYLFLTKLVEVANAPVNLANVIGTVTTSHGGANPTPSGSAVPAPKDAEYIVAAADPILTAERVATDTATVAWDFGTAAQAKADVPDNAITYAKMQNVSAASRLLGRGSASGAGDPEEITLGVGLTMAGTELSSSASPGTLFWDEVLGDYLIAK